MYKWALRLWWRLKRKQICHACIKEGDGFPLWENQERCGYCRILGTYAG
jgi:hypothetical protein